MIYLYKWKFFIAIVIAQRNQQIKNVKKINRKKKYQAKTGGTSALFLILWSSFLIEKKMKSTVKKRMGKKMYQQQKKKRIFFCLYLGFHFSSVKLCCYNSNEQEKMPEVYSGTFSQLVSGALVRGQHCMNVLCASGPSQESSSPSPA